MTERDSSIIELTRQGLSARKICERLGLSISSDQVSRIARKHVGTTPSGANSVPNALGSIRVYVLACMVALGKDPHFCDLCREIQANPCDIHHTKYAGATLFDLVFACRSCNLSRVNKGLT